MYNWLQQRNGPMIHDVARVKYNKEDNIFHPCFPRLDKKVQKQKIKNTNMHFFHCKISTLLALLFTIFSDT